MASYADARHQRGAWFVRIEDIDIPRTVAGAADNILRTLEAYGMQWDEEVIYQSARLDAYHAALEQLRAQNLIYPCACSRKEIADSSTNAGIDGLVYPGTCRHGLLEGKTARAWRVLTENAGIAFDDAAQGHIAHNLANDIGDFVLYRADGIFAYQLAVVVDDAEQDITDVVRGADLLDSTTRQIYLQQKLGFTTPRYLHVPVATDSNGQKLSKQTLAQAVDIENPISALFAALNFLGQMPAQELLSSDVKTFWKWTIEHWDKSRIPRARSLSFA